METNTAEITAVEAKTMDYANEYCVKLLLIDKGLKAKGRFRPVLLGKMYTWHDRVTGTYHYFQEIGCE